MNVVLRDKSLFSTSQEADEALQADTLRRHEKHRQRTKQRRITKHKPPKPRGNPPPPRSSPPPSTVAAGTSPPKKTKSREIGGNPAPWRQRSHFEREMAELGFEDIEIVDDSEDDADNEDDDKDDSEDSSIRTSQSTIHEQLTFQSCTMIATPIVVLLLAVAISFLSTLSLLHPSMDKSFQLLTNQQAKKTSVEAKIAAYSALTAANSGSSLAANQLLSCSDPSSHQRIVAAFSTEIDIRLYFVNASNINDWCGSINNTKVNINANTIDVSHLHAIVQQTKTTQPWMWNHSVFPRISKDDNFRLFYVLHAGTPTRSPYHVIASVELKENLQNKMIKEEKQQKSIKTTGEISVEVEIESVSVASKGGSQNHIKAAKTCCSNTKTCGKTNDLVSTFISSCSNTNATLSRTDSSNAINQQMHPNFVVGSSAERVFVYEDQESLIISVVIYTIVCAVVIAFIQLLSIQGTIDPSESLIAVALTTFICVFAALSYTVSSTSRDLENVVSDVAMLQASSLQNSVSFEMNKLTSMMTVLSMDKEYISNQVLIDISNVVDMEEASPVGLVYYGEKATGNFYGVSNNEFIVSNTNTSFKTTAFSMYTHTYIDPNSNIKMSTKLINQSNQLSQGEDTYDPRKRPWYTLAMQHYASGNKTAIWSNVYPFFGGENLDNGLGITVAKALSDGSGVVAVDITLEKISKLLQTKLHDLGKFNGSTSLWVSEIAPLGEVIGVGKGEASKDLQRLHPNEISEIEKSSTAVKSVVRDVKIYKETHERFGNGVLHQEITFRKINGGALSDGLNWWLVQSMQFSQFIREVQHEGSAALLVGIILCAAAAVSTRCGNKTSLLLNKTDKKRMRSQRKAFKIAAEMRRETIRMTKNMSPLVLNDMIGTMLSKSLRKYALTLEFFSHKYGVLSLQNPRIAMIYENMLDTDAWWHLFVFCIQFVHLSMSFFDSPIHSFQNFVVLAVIQGICISVECFDVALRIGVICSHSKLSFRGQLSTPSLRLSNEFLQLTGALHICCCVLVVADFLYRVSIYSNTTSTIALTAAQGIVVYSAPLRAIIIVLAHNSFLEAFTAFLSTVWKAKNIFSLGMQFLLVVVGLLISCLQGSYNISNEIGRGLSSFEGSFLTNFIFIFTSSNYADLVYGHSEFGTIAELPYSLFFLLVILIGMFLFLSILLSVFQTEFTDKFTSAETSRRREREEGYSVVFICLSRKQAATENSILSRQLSKENQRLSNLRTGSEEVDMKKVRNDVSLKITKELVFRAFVELNGSDVNIATAALKDISIDQDVTVLEFYEVCEKLRIEMKNSKVSHYSSKFYNCICGCTTSNENESKNAQIFPSTQTTHSKTNNIAHQANHNNERNAINSDATTKTNCFQTKIYRYVRILLVFSNAWVVCFLATERGKIAGIHFHLAITSIFLFLHVLDILAHFYFFERANRADVFIVIVSLIIFFVSYVPIYVTLTRSMAIMSTTATATTNATATQKDTFLSSATRNATRTFQYYQKRSSTPEKLALALPNLRIFTTIKTTQHLSLGLLSLMSKPQIADLFTLLLLFLYMFGVVGCSLFGGKFKLLAESGAVNKAANFDSFPETLRTMFHMLLGDFTDLMYSGIDSYGSLWPAMYFISFAVIMALVFTNLVVGVVCDLYLGEIYAPMIATKNVKSMDGSGSSGNSGGSGVTEEKTIENPFSNETAEPKMTDVLRENAILHRENARLIAALKMTKMKRALPHILRARKTNTSYEI